MDHMDHMGHEHHHHEGMDMDMDHNASMVTTPSSGDHVVAATTGEHNHDHHCHHDMHGGMMSMFFHTGYAETILFSFWKIDSIGGLIGSMIGIFLMAMVYEGLKVFREYLLQSSLGSEPMRHGLGNKAGGRLPLENNASEGETPEGSTVNDINGKTILRPHPCSILHWIQTFLHMIQVFISYLLMLIFMTYNVWLCVAVILGAGAGYFVFGWRKRTIIDINEHCH